LYYAQCVLQEASYWTILARTTSLLDDDLERDIDALSLKFLVDLVSNGERYPNLVWEEKFKKKLPVFDSAPTPA